MIKDSLAYLIGIVNNNNPQFPGVTSDDKYVDPTRIKEILIFEEGANGFDIVKTMTNPKYCCPKLSF